MSVYRHSYIGAKQTTLFGTETKSFILLEFIYDWLRDFKSLYIHSFIHSFIITNCVLLSADPGGRAV